MDKIYESFTCGGRLVYQKIFTAGKTRYTGARIIVQRAVQQADGSWWLYTFDNGMSPGTPLRSKDRQDMILNFVHEVKKNLAEEIRNGLVDN